VRAVPRVEKIAIQVLCHATEDLKKVLKAVENVVGSEAAKAFSTTSETLKGYYGDPVTLMRVFLLDENTCERVFLRILSNLSELERDELWRERAKRGKHGGKIFVRLDKQEAFRGRIRQSDKDPIRVMVEIRGNLDSMRERLEKRLQELEASDAP